MQQYEYRVLPAPEEGRRARGAKGPAERFAHQIEQVINQMAAEGWQYHRAECLPSTERRGLGRRQVVHRSLLVFCRPLPGAAIPTPPDGPQAALTHAAAAAAAALRQTRPD